MSKKKAFKWVGGIILTPIILFVLLAVLIYLPPVQNWLVQHVAAYASEKTGMDISVGSIKLVFPLDLGVEDFRMIQRNDSLPQVKDTVADVKQLVVKIQFMPLLEKKVEIDALEFNDMKLNTADFVHEARVKGSIGRLYVRSHGIDLGKETVKINDAILRDATVNVELSDTVPPDTSETKNYWKIAVSKLAISNTGVTVHLPGDTLQVAAFMGNTDVRNGYFDLYKGLYKVEALDWKNGKLSYDNNFETHAKGLDYNHITLSDIRIGIDTLSYCSPKLSLNIRECSFKEKSGITVESITGPLALDSNKVNLPSVYFKTPDSYLRANFEMDLNAFDTKSPGKIRLVADGAFGKHDIMRFIGDMPTSFIRKWPNRPLMVKTVLTGNLKRLDFTGLNVKLPTAFSLNAKGFAENLTDDDKLGADVSLEAKTYDLGFVAALINSQGNSGFIIPYGIGMKGRFRARGKQYYTDFTATEGGGRLKAKADMNLASMSYVASLSAENLRLSHFLPGSGMGDFSGSMKLKGTGTDFTSASTRLLAKAGIHKFTYDKYNLDGVSFDADMSKGKAHASIVSSNPLLDGDIIVDADVSKSRLRSSFVANLRKLDFYGLKITEEPLSTSFRGRIDFDTDMKLKIRASGDVSDLIIKDSEKEYHPDKLVFDVLTSSDTTHIGTYCGDFKLRFDGKGGYKKIMAKGSRFAEELLKELKDKRIEINKLRTILPYAEFELNTGKENPLSRLLAMKGYKFNDAAIAFTSSPDVGLNGGMQLIELQNGKINLDTVRFSVVSDSSRCTYHGQVRNSKENKDYVFNAFMDGYVFEKGSGVNVKFYDSKDSLGLNLGVEASLEDEGIKAHILTDSTILGYKKFDVNEDNYIFLGNDKHVFANLLLKADDGMGVHIYSNNENEDALQDITVGLNRFDLKKILSSIPYMPRITGIMNGDFHLIQTREEMSLSSALSVDSMTYENVRMGNISTEFVYMPRTDGTHSVDGTLSYNGTQVADVSGSYNSSGDGDNLNVDMTMDHFPMRLLNGFIPDRMARFSGYSDGNIAIKGSLDHPRANGELALDSCRMRSSQYGVSLQLSEGPIRIVGSNILFEDFKMLSSNNSPLTLNGNIDLSDMSAMRMDLRMAAKNFQIIDSKERRRSIAFGKAFVDFFASVNGTFDNMKMLGRLDVLGSTDMSYILRDSPLSTDNQMDDLVKFTSFSDTTSTVVKHSPMSGFTMDLTMNISQGARIMCYLNTSHSNYIDLMGGGNLRLRYNDADDLRLTGKYTLDNGEMKYSLPVIPLKTFTIQDGSYIEFTGDPMNPRLNITATERTKANVGANGGAGRTVEFDCGVVITKTLSDMGLEFTLDAPEDMSLHNELLAMSVEQRGKLAVTMLTTGMYLADGNTGGFSMNNALSSFLQSEINSITGNALRTLDLSFGMDNSTDASGNTHTDYSFKFAKRFWNNKLRIVVGGKVSTGAEVANQNESFFDNVTFEYRLGNSADKYVTLFYDNNAYDWLEGNTREYGVGFIWRRSVQSFRDLFRFKKASTLPVPADTTKTKR